MNKQPKEQGSVEALRLADLLEDDLHADNGTTLGLYSQGIADNAAAELRRLHSVNAELLEALKGLAKIYDAMGEPRGPTRILADTAIDCAEGRQK